ncbi:MAG TPA: putative 2OG-Fe(II) oxygenase [Rhizomicrobium sp.]|nr:putative 2OG-Fe(II) oxygenase [Rhizomicrobium sp.]
MIRWTPADCETVAAPARVLPLLLRAIAAAPASAELQAKLGNVHLDLYDFAAAANAFDAALALDPTRNDVRLRLARCRNVLGRPGEAIAVIEGLEDADAHAQRGLAHAALGQDAEADFRAALAADPAHRRACMRLCAILRDSGRIAELLALCESLASRGVDHAQLLLDWGRALALNGDLEKSRRLLFDPARLAKIDLALPAGFNQALAEELLANPVKVSDFPAGEEANRGSTRIHHLLAGPNPDLVRTLIDSIQAAVAAHAAALSPAPGFDPWTAARPAAAHLHPWGLIQRGGEYEAWHTHRGGWLSGVYYVHVPPQISAAGDGSGCIEFGPPGSVRERLPDFMPVQRIAPREGLLLLAPSHYHHRTIPNVDATRISFAFDVVPDMPTSS